MKVIEFLGMPKSGKSTAIEIAESYLKRQGKRIRTIYEGARVSPLDKKDRFMYNGWSFHNTVNRILEARLDHYDFILVDRGVNDHIIFSQAIKSFCNQNIADIQKYYKMFQGIEDESFLYLLTAKESIEREKKHNPFLGRVFNNGFLNNLYQEYLNWGKKNCRPKDIFNGGNSLKENSEILLDKLEVFLKPKRRKCEKHTTFSYFMAPWG